MMVLKRFFLLGSVSLLLGACAHTGEPGKNSDKKVNAQPIAQKAASKKLDAFQQRPKPSIASQRELVATPPDFWTQLRTDFALPELNNDRVTYYEKRFSRHPDYVKRVFDRARWFLPHIYQQTKARGFPAEVALLPAVESAFKPDALSFSKASGLWQFIGSTATIYQLDRNQWYDARRDPVLATEAAMTFLGELEQRFDGDWFHAFAGYNAGGTTIERAIKRNRKNNKGTDFVDLKLRTETTDYVPKLIAWRNIVRDPQRYGITLPSMPLDTQFAQIDTGTQTNIRLLAKLIDVDDKTLQFLNRAYHRGITPPQGPHLITVPADKAALTRTKLASLSKHDHMYWASYQIKKGDVLGKIAKTHGVSVASIRDTNKIRGNLIHPGNQLLIPMNQPLNTAAKAPSPSTKKVTHRVRRGETLWEIARQYSVKVAQLSNWNRSIKGSRIKPGQRLVVFPGRS